jgi:hypothetical protein
MLLPVLSVLLDTSRQPGIETPKDDSMGSNVRHDMLFRAAKLCLSVTKDLVNLITKKAESAPESLPAPWYNIFCKFNPNASTLAIPVFISASISQYKMFLQKTYTALQWCSSSATSAPYM